MTIATNYMTIQIMDGHKLYDPHFGIMVHELYDITMMVHELNDDTNHVWTQII